MSAALPLRVMVLDTWEEVPLSLPPETRVADLKARALAEAKVRRSPAEYMVKFRGAELAEAHSLADAKVVSDANLIVLPRRRQPAR